jgi:hypothetical protein
MGLLALPDLRVSAPLREIFWSRSGGVCVVTGVGVVWSRGRTRSRRERGGGAGEGEWDCWHCLISASLRLCVRSSGRDQAACVSSPASAWSGPEVARGAAENAEGERNTGRGDWHCLVSASLRLCVRPSGRDQAACVSSLASVWSGPEVARRAAENAEGGNGTRGMGLLALPGLRVSAPLREIFWSRSGGVRRHRPRCGLVQRSHAEPQRTRRGRGPREQLRL